MSYPNLTKGLVYCLGFILYCCLVGLCLLPFILSPLPSWPFLAPLLVLPLWLLTALTPSAVDFMVSWLSSPPPAAGGDEALLVKLIPNQISKSGQSQVLLQLLKTNPATRSSSSPPPTPGCQRKLREALRKKDTGLIGNFSQYGGGVFPIPKTFVID